MARGDLTVPEFAARTCLVVVTYNRSGYLARLIDSIAEMSPLPGSVVIVDNASTDDTQRVIEHFRLSGFARPVTNHRLEQNLGGSGGFSTGVEIALEQGAEWVWMMDDDVRVLPDALDSLDKWTSQFGVLHGRRYDHDGKPFFWQTRISEILGIFYPRPGNVFKHKDYFRTNSGTFEGMLVHRGVVEQIGLPDPRFFLTWDDAVYAWLASRVTDVGYVNEFVLQRLRPQRSISLGIRHLNDSSDLSRFYVMRNRGYVAQYLREHRAYHPAGFAIGTCLTFGKEAVRSLAVERTFRGFTPLVKGYLESRTIRHDADWQPMHPWVSHR